MSRLAVDDRGVALLGGQRGGGQGGIRRAPEGGEHLGREGGERPCPPRHGLAVGDGREHGGPQRGLPPGLAQQPLRLRPLHPGDDGLGGPLLHLRGARAHGHGQGEDIGLRLALPVGDRDKGPIGDGGVVREAHDLGQHGGADLARLAAEPAPLLQVRRQERFEGGFRLALEDGLPRPCKRNTGDLGWCRLTGGRDRRRLGLHGVCHGSSSWVSRGQRRDPARRGPVCHPSQSLSTFRTLPMHRCRPAACRVPCRCAVPRACVTHPRLHMPLQCSLSSAPRVWSAPRAKASRCIKQRLARAPGIVPCRRGIVPGISCASPPVCGAPSTTPA